MNCHKLLQGITALMVTMLFLSACHTPRPAFIGTPAPLPTATPIPGIGVPVAGNRWQVTVEGARRASSLTVGFILDKKTYTPNAGYTFLVVDVTFNDLSPALEAGIPTQSISVVGKSEKTAGVYGVGGLTDSFVCVECSVALRPAVLQHLAFIVKEEDIDQPWELLVEKVPSVPFSVGGTAQHTFTTEVGNEPSRLPGDCQVDPRSLSSIGPLVYGNWQDSGLTLASMSADGTRASPICTGVASAKLKRAPDGAALLLLDFQAGWKNLYVVEPDGKAFVVVENSPEIEAQFDPTGRYVVFTTTKIGVKERKVLYIFDRKAALTRQINEWKWINYRFLSNGRLLISVWPIGGSRNELYWVQAEGSILERLDLPKDIYLYDIADDGEHIVKTKSEGSSYYLTISKLDGSSSERLLAASEWTSGRMSPNGQFILYSVPRGKVSNSVELRNLTTADHWTVVPESESFQFSFSVDSRWALVYVNAEGRPSALHIVSTVDGRVVREIEDVVNATFSPDSTQLAYTVLQADNTWAMYVFDLETQAMHSLGAGILYEWLPAGLTP